MGVHRGDVFIPTEILISADTLGEEEAIRWWLAEHDMHVALSCRNAAPLHKGCVGGDRSIGDTRENGDAG
jgi:hypothetical protein